ncbi:MFS transporter [uncultured Jatrophihabitans sp.]|uniref:MFS transporter n=1 Tax=uncultured Jatrophihabitans sp. TaxID=1610747 RepID=UPI0035CC4E11
MAKKQGDRPGGRFSKSGHTTHRPPVEPPAPAYPTPSSYPPSSYPAQPPAGRRPDDFGAQPGYQSAPPSYAPAGADPYGSPTYHHTPAARQASAAGAQRGVGRAAVAGTNRAARLVTRKVIDASKADGAEESGLTALIWNQVLSYGTDAMITVALAGTVFFGASAHAQRGNVLLYLLITMAPFAVIAPVIGPALDRLQHGRRWTMAGTAIGRAVLALIMAGHPTELLVLYPCALGSLVLSKAYGVVRAAAAPRLVPPGMTLTEANARLTIFGLASTLVLGGLVGVVIKVTGSYSVGLIVTAIGFAACGVFAFRLPKQVDSAVAAPRHPEEPGRASKQVRVPPLKRIQQWAGYGFPQHLVIALQGESALRLLSGMLTIYLAFYVESTRHGFPAVLDLGLVIGAAGVGNFLGTAIGTRLKMVKPEVVIIVSTCVAAAVCLIVGLVFNIAFAAAGMLVASVGNALSKIGLDALIQRDVVETLRSSAFARSETFLQLAWVIGAAIAVGLPSNSKSNGTLAFLVAGVIVGAVGAVIVLRNRAMNRATPPRRRGGHAPAAGSVGGPDADHSVD